MNDVQDDAERPGHDPAQSASDPGLEPAERTLPAERPERELPAERPESEEREEREEPVQLRLRRAPRYGAFGMTGLVIGIVIGLILAYSHAAEGDYTQRTIAGYFAASFGLIGVLAGLAAAVLAERRR